MTIYVDSLFLMNFFMDTVILFSVKLFIKSGKNLKYIFAGAFFLAVYGTLPIINTLSFLYNPFFVVATPVAITYLVFGKEKFFKSITSFWLSALTLGGIVYGMMCISDLTTCVYTKSLTIYYLDINPLISFLGCIILYIIMYATERNAVRLFSRQRLLIDIEIEYMSQSLKLRCLIDTGCCLTEPLTGKPMIIIEKEAFSDMLTGLTYENFITVNTANGKSILPIIFPKQVSGENDLYSIDSADAKLPIAITEKKLCYDGLYNAIINPDALKDKPLTSVCKENKLKYSKFKFKNRTTFSDKYNISYKSDESYNIDKILNFTFKRSISK